MAEGLYIPYDISIESSQGASASGFTVKLFNRTTGETLSATFNSSGQAIIDIANFTSGYSMGDVIEVKVLGKIEGSTTHTVVNAGFGDVSLTTAAVSSSLPDISL